MKKILKSVLTIAVVGAVAFGVSQAFLSDTEISSGNTFTAGSIDLKVDSECHYYQKNDSGEYVNVGCGAGTIYGNWAETDLGDGVHKFFNFADLKPGDWGEDTISLHVYDNDAWGKMVIDVTSNSDNGCTEPEYEAESGCTQNGPGELLGKTLFSLWLDQGSTPGFQNQGPNAIIDQQEGDNVWQSATEPLLDGVVPFGGGGGTGEVDITNGILDPVETYNLWEALSGAYYYYECNTGTYSGANPDGHNNYEACHGLAADGRMVGSAVYQFGVAWQIPYELGNEAQTDSFGGDLTFNVVQRRNNPNRDF